MKAKAILIAEKCISVASRVLVLVFALTFAILALCALFCAVVEGEVISLVACAASAFIAWVCFELYRGLK